MSKQIKSEMAGSVWEIKVKVGDKVTAGQEVAVVESMKMEVPVLSPQAGTISAIHKQKGDFLNEGEVLMELQ